MSIIPRTAVAAALEVENYVVKELDRGLGLGAERLSRGEPARELPPE